MARRAADTSGEGGSPKMKNFMKAPIRMTMESCPNSRPWVKDSEDSALSSVGFGIDISLHANKM